MKRLHFLIFALLGIGANSYAQFRLADNIEDAEFVCASQLEWTITSSYTTQASDPAPCGDARNQSAWFKVQGFTAGNIDLNFQNIATQTYAVSVYGPFAEGVLPTSAETALACKIVTNGDPTVTFPYTGSADNIFYVMVDGESDAEGSITLSATGSAVASPGLILTPSRVIGCYGNLVDNVVRFTNSSTDNGGNNEFELEITFESADLEGVNTTGWIPPTVVSIQSATLETINDEIGPNGSRIYRNFPRNAVIELASGYPGTWEATLKPLNHECFDADFSSTTNSSRVQRLVVRRTDETFNPLEDFSFCEQNELRDWYGKAELLPEASSSANVATIQSWSWTFKDEFGSDINVITDTDPEFTAGDVNISTAIIDFPVPDANKNRFSIEIDVQGTCGPAEGNYILQAYVPQDPIITPLEPTCIDNISNGNPINFSVTNTESLSPKPIGQPIGWDFGSLSTASNISGTNGEIVTISDTSLFAPGTYPIEATLTDEGDCFTTSTFDLDIVAKASITILDTIPETPRVQCNQFVFNENDVVDFTFEVNNVLPAQGANIIVTYNGLEILNTPQATVTETYTIKVTHTGSEADLISIRVDNAAFPSVGNCPTELNIGMLLEKEEPILTIEGSTDIVCISDVNGSNPLRVVIPNADNILGGASLISTNWSINTADAVVASETPTGINYSSLPVGTYIITADVSYNGGICFEQINIPVTIVTQEEIVISDPIPINPSELNTRCNEFVYNQGDVVSFNATISNLVDPVVITVKRGDAILNTFSPQPTAYNPDSTFVVTFEVTHNGDDIDLITVEVENQTFPSVCIASRPIAMRLFQDDLPTIAPINPVFCVKEISADNPVSFSITSPTSLPDIASVDWSVVDNEGNPVNVFTSTPSINDISMTGFEVGSYQIQAEVNYVSGCMQPDTTRFTVLGQPDFLAGNITTLTAANTCIDPNGFQVGDQIQYDFSLSNIQEPIEIVATFPGGSQTFSASTTDFSESITFTIIDEELSEGGIWIAGNISITSQNGCEDTYPIEIPVVQNPLEISPSQNESVCVSGNNTTLAIQVLSAPAGIPSFVWTGDNVPENSNSSTVTLTNLEDGETYLVEANVTSADGICTRTVNFVVNVNVDLPTLTTNVVTSPDNTDCNGNTGFCRGDLITIEYTASANGGLTEDFEVVLDIPGYVDGSGNPLSDEPNEHTPDDNTGSFLLTVQDEDIVGTIGIYYVGKEECIATFPINIPVIPLAVAADGDNNAVCSGELVREIGVIPTCDDYTVSWVNSPNQNLITSATLNGNNITVDFTGQASGFYTFEAEVTGNNCARIITQTLEFSDNLPDQILGPTGIAGFCIGDLPQNNFLLTVGKETGEFDVSQVSFDWSITPTANQQFFRAGTSLTGNTIILDIPANTPVGNYDFNVLVRDRDPDNDCEREMTYTLQIVDNDVIQITTETSEVCDFSETSITASGGLSGEYVWSRLDPDTRQVIEVYQETSATLNIVTNEAETFLFTVEDAAAPPCIAGGEFTLTVTSCALDIPNAFTPGPEDEINATFEVPRIENRDWDFIVYNRYGDVIYQNDNYDNSWDGESLPEGIYFYLLTSPEKTQEYKGWVRILRNNIQGDTR